MAGKGYREIFETLRREILDGKYDVEKTLPSEFGLARRFKVCRPTVSRAMQELVSSGLVVRRQGAPTTLTRFAQNATGCMGLVIQGRLHGDGVYPQVCRRLFERAERGGWKMLRCEIRATSKRGRIHELRAIIDRLTAERVTGVFFQPVECLPDAERFNRDAVGRIEKAGIHVVLLDYDIVRFPDRSNCDLVGVDNFAAGYTMGAHLMEVGARRIAFLNHPYAAPSVAERLRGVAFAVAERTGVWMGMESDLVIDGLDAHVLRKWFRKVRPSAIVAYNDSAAIHLCESLREIGIRPGVDVSVVGFDDIPAARENLPPLTTMRQDVNRIAELAFQTLVMRIKMPTLPPRKVLVPCELLVRKS